MAQIMETAPAEMRTKSAIEDRQVLGTERGGIEPIRFGFAGNNGGIVGTWARILNGIEQIDVFDRADDFFLHISQMFQCGPDRLVDDFQHATASEQFVDRK